MGAGQEHFNCIVLKQAKILVLPLGVPNLCQGVKPGPLTLATLICTQTELKMMQDLMIFTTPIVTSTLTNFVTFWASHLSLLRCIWCIMEMFTHLSQEMLFFWEMLEIIEPG